MDLRHMQAKQSPRKPLSGAAAAILGNGANALPGVTARGSPGRSAIPLSARASLASSHLSSSSSARLKIPLEKLLDHRSTSTLLSSSQNSDALPGPILFAKNKPTSRADAAVLNRWITSVLDRYAEKMASSQEESSSLLQVVDELVPNLSIGLHELTRQVSQQCVERGVVLEKIWRTYVELFDRALAEARALVRFHKTRTQRVRNAYSQTTEELAEVKRRQPDQIDKLSKTLASKFQQRQGELEAMLQSVKHENAIMQQLIGDHRESTKSWFPLFEKYKDSALRVTLQSAHPELPTHTTPESRIAADFKRILVAMPVEARRRVGFFVSSLLGLRGTELVENPETVESLNERKEHNAWKMNLLELRIKELHEQAAARSPSKQSQHSV